MLLLDADMELRVDGPLPFPLHAPAYSLLQRQWGLNYYNTRLVARGAPARYYGVTHEYLSVEGDTRLPNDCWWFQDYATGSNRGDKFSRDIKLLRADLALHPENPRSWFYLAQSYRDNGEFQKAIDAYTRRIEIGGWDEEIWYSKLAMARTYRAMGKEPEFILNSLAAYNTRPKRAEPLHDLAFHHRLKGDNVLAYMFAEAGARIPYPDDQLFIEKDVYESGLLEEKAIAGFYQDSTRAAGFAACDKLSLMKEASHDRRELARTNLAHYLQPLKTFAPSWKTTRVPFTAPDDKYVCSNPSIAVHQGQLELIVRTVNYVIREDGSYDMQGDSAIRTKNFLLSLTPELTASGPGLELVNPVDWPAPKSTQVMGFEDMRLISWRGDLWTSSTVLEQNADCWREIWLTNIDTDTGVLAYARHLKTPAEIVGRVNEKNWMPFVDCGELRFLYRPGLVIDANSRPVAASQCKLDVSTFCGSGQLVFFEGGWVGVIHESRPDPYTGKRYYQHRFIWLSNHEFVLQKISPPFCFFERQIEFCCGFARRPFVNEFILSFGVKDREAWLGTISAEDLRCVLWK
jgi:tetratricopeptide (TPR) repeat protein